MATKYDYVRVPVSPAEREFLNELVRTGKGKNAGAVIRKMAFDPKQDDLWMKYAMEAVEDIGEIRNEIIRLLLKGPTLYESDLIEIDDKLYELANSVAMLIGGR